MEDGNTPPPGREPFPRSGCKEPAKMIIARAANTMFPKYIAGERPTEDDHCSSGGSLYPLHTPSWERPGEDDHCIAAIIMFLLVLLPWKDRRKMIIARPAITISSLVLLPGRNRRRFHCSSGDHYIPLCNPSWERPVEDARSMRLVKPAPRCGGSSVKSIGEPGILPGTTGTTIACPTRLSPAEADGEELYTPGTPSGFWSKRRCPGRRSCSRWC